MSFSTDRRTVLAGMAGMAAMLPLAACGGTGEASSGGGLEKSSITVGALPVVDYVGLWVAQQKGLFKKHGLTVKLEVLAGGAVAVPKLAAGSLDFSIINYVSAIQATQTKTAPMKILLDAYQINPGSAAVVVPADSPIKKPQDLQGKKIAVNTKGNVPQLLIEAGLKPYNVTIPDANFSEVELPQVVTALKSHSVDASWVVEPFLTLVEKSLGGRIVLDLAKGPTANFPIGAYTTTQKFAEENPNTTKAFKTSLIEAAKMIADDPGLVKETLPSYAKIDAKTAKLIHIATYPESVSAQRVQQVSDLMTQFGFLKEHFDVKSMV